MNEVTLKIRRRDPDPAKRRRPFYCGNCRREVEMSELTCHRCGTPFMGWIDETGDRGRVERDR